MVEHVTRLAADGMAGVLGVDMTASLALCRAHGLPESLMGDLLLQAEAGLAEGLADKRRAGEPD